MTEFRNQEELNKALNIYRRAMCDFIFEYLRRKVRGETAEDLIGRIVNRKPSNLEPKHISQIFGHRECRNLFKQRFGYSQLDDRDKYDIESVTALITMGRNIVYHHAGTTDLDSEFTRAYLFLIADILGKIDNPDAKREVEDIRNNLFFPNAAYKENLADITKQLETANAEKTELEKRLKTMSDQLKDVERENAAYQKRIGTLPDQLEAAKAEKAKYEKTLKAASNRLATLKKVNAQLEEHLEVTSTRLEDVEAELTACKKDLARTLRQLEGTTAEQTEYLSLDERLALLKGNGKTTTPRRGYPSSEERLARALTESEKGETGEEQVEIAKRVAELRLNPDASKKMSWKNIREEALLTIDEFHRNIRISDYYKEIMLERLGNLIDEGWVYNGCLNILCGFDVPEEFVERMESNKAKAKVAETPSYRGNTAKSPKSQRKWRRPGAVAALRDPAEIREAEAKIANILIPVKKLA